jgi:hypothetical protein
MPANSHAIVTFCTTEYARHRGERRDLANAFATVIFEVERLSADSPEIGPPLSKWLYAWHERPALTQACQVVREQFGVEPP